MSASSSRDGTETDWPSIVAVTLGITAFATAQGLTYPRPVVPAERPRRERPRHRAARLAAFHAGALRPSRSSCCPHQNRRHRAGVLIVAGLLGAAATLICFALTENQWLWFILRFCLGYCVNTIYVLGEAWLNAAASDRVRGRVARRLRRGHVDGLRAGPPGHPSLRHSGRPRLRRLRLHGRARRLRASRSWHGVPRVEPEPVVLREVLSFFRLAPHLLLLVVVFGVMDSTTIAVIPVHLTRGGPDPGGGGGLRYRPACGHDRGAARTGQPARSLRPLARGEALSRPDRDQCRRARLRATRGMGDLGPQRPWSGQRSSAPYTSALALLGPGSPGAAR